jgi:hypothetical protein
MRLAAVNAGRSLCQRAQADERKHHPESQFRTGRGGSSAASERSTHVA